MKNVASYDLEWICSYYIVMLKSVKKAYLIKSQNKSKIFGLMSDILSNRCESMRIDVNF